MDDQEIRTGRKWRGRGASEQAVSQFVSGTNICTGKELKLSGNLL